MVEGTCKVLPADHLLGNRDWLDKQPVPVISFGGHTPNADVVVGSHEQAIKLAERINTHPIAALTLVQVLRLSDRLSAPQALDVESMAYATLQGGAEFMRWKEQQDILPVKAQALGPPIRLLRVGNELYATLNRPNSRNSMNVEMRDAWVEMLSLLNHDASITRLHLNALGNCFSSGGDLGEFGSRPDVGLAHWIRTVQSPARLMAEHGHKTVVRVHGACIGSGVELSAFAARVEAASNTHFVLPELKMGLIPGAGGTVSIARRIGRQRTALMALSGRRINSRTALEWGLIDEIVPT